MKFEVVNIYYVYSQNHSSRTSSSGHDRRCTVFDCNGALKTRRAPLQRVGTIRTERIWVRTSMESPWPLNSCSSSAHAHTILDLLLQTRSARNQSIVISGLLSSALRVPLHSRNVYILAGPAMERDVMETIVFLHIVRTRVTIRIRNVRSPVLAKRWITISARGSATKNNENNKSLLARPIRLEDTTLQSYRYVRASWPRRVSDLTAVATQIVGTRGFFLFIHFVFHVCAAAWCVGTCTIRKRIAAQQLLSRMRAHIYVYIASFAVLTFTLWFTSVCALLL